MVYYLCVIYMDLANIVFKTGFRILPKIERMILWFFLFLLLLLFF